MTANGGTVPPGQRRRSQDNLRYPDAETRAACHEAAELAAMPFNQYAIAAMLGPRPPSKERLHAIFELREIGLTLKGLKGQPMDRRAERLIDASMKRVLAAIMKMRA